MPKPAYHIFVCTNTRPPVHPRGSCGENNAMAIMEKFGMGIEKRMLFGKALLSNTGCMGPCSTGPVVVVYPDGVWYKGVQPDDVDEILDSHIVNGKKAERLEIPAEMW